ncbi:AraC family transcriptional regulator [Sphingobacterium multivorum]|nr:helix-turn-helix domain-containing protein [Sphingobacterium multivorum]QQT33075.1 AraC family transcriptional regulator [Sphingobacterium multivorum]
MNENFTSFDRSSKGLDMSIVFNELNNHITEKWPKVDHFDYFTMILSVKGNGYHTIDSTKYPMDAHQIHLVFPGQKQEIQLNRSSILYSIVIDRMLFNALTSKFKLMYTFFNYQPVIKLCDIGFQRIHDEFLAIRNELNNEDSNMNILKLHLRIIGEIVDREASRYLAIDEQGKNKILEEFRRLVKENFKVQKKAFFYAKEMNISYNHLNNNCKKALSRTAAQLIYDQIIEEAKKLLDQSDLSVKEIAFELGFADSAYFTRFFKQQTSLTPSDFRKLR